VKTARHERIRDIIESQIIETQDDLAQALRKAALKYTGNCFTRYQGIDADKDT
jgi:arginine repressor